MVLQATSVELTLGSGQSKIVGYGIVCRSGTAERYNSRAAVLMDIPYLSPHLIASNESCCVVSMG